MCHFIVSFISFIQVEPLKLCEVIPTICSKKTRLGEKRKWDFTSKPLVSQRSYFFFAEFAESRDHVMLLPSHSGFVLTCCDLGGGGD